MIIIHKLHGISTRNIIDIYENKSLYDKKTENSRIVYYFQILSVTNNSIEY